MDPRSFDGVAMNIVREVAPSRTVLVAIEQRGDGTIVVHDSAGNAREARTTGELSAAVRAVLSDNTLPVMETAQPPTGDVLFSVAKLLAGKGTPEDFRPIIQKGVEVGQRVVEHVKQRQATKKKGWFDRDDSVAMPYFPKEPK